VKHPSDPSITKGDIETLIQYGEQVGEHEAVVAARREETRTYFHKLPESIRQHAKLIDDKLRDIKVCDPAIGSGAFPVGMMHEIVKARNVLTAFIDPPVSPLNKGGSQESPLAKGGVKMGFPLDKRGIKGGSRTVYHFKRECIERSLYGVDIDPGAVEIAKLRLWLSLVVDEDDYKQIQPLPNLDYKIVCGNSLLGVEKNLFNNELFAELERLKPLHINETNPTQKQELKNRIDALISEITNGHREFDFEVYFSEVIHVNKGFDVIIGNPPYGFRNVLTQHQKQYFRKVENIEFSSGDSAELFSKKCFDNLVKESGVLSFIIPKKSLYGDAWEGFRRDYWMKYDLLFLLDSSKAFQDVLLEANAFGLARKNNNVPVKCTYLTKNDEVFEFATGFKKDIFLENLTAQIYKLMIPSEIWSKIENNRVKEKLVKGRLGLAIGTDFFSDKETKYKLLKGIDIDRWRIKSHRWLKNVSRLNWDTAKQFLKPKIITQVLVAHIENPNPHVKITACFDEEGIIITNTLMSFELDERIDPKFWLAYLNSAFVSWYAYNFVYTRAIRTMHFYDFYIQQIPIPHRGLSTKVQKQFVELVNRILAITKDEDYLNNPQKKAQVKSLENQIDLMVYKLYGLTWDEVNIVDPQIEKIISQKEYVHYQP